MHKFLNMLARRIKYPKHSNLLNRIINQMYYSPGEVMIRKKDIDYVVTEKCKFYPSEHLNTLIRTEGNPWFERIKEDDIVLDIGACIGSVAIPLAKKAKKVYAVEPLLYEELQRNIELNKLTNPEVISQGIGKGETKIEYGDCSGTALLVSLKTLLESINEDRVDFLKMDCEGCEWEVNPKEVLGIRELRIEFHRRRGERDTRKVAEWVDFLEHNGYKVDMDTDVHKEASIIVRRGDCLL